MKKEYMCRRKKQQLCGRKNNTYVYDKTHICRQTENTYVDEGNIYVDEKKPHM